MERGKPIWVRCPACGWEQRTRSRTYVRCFRCGHSYKIFPRRRRSRIVEKRPERKFMGYKLAWNYIMGGKA